MKIKEVDRTANIAWSPVNQYPIYLAAGTAAQQLDATFNTSASLEIFELNLNESSSEISVKASLNCDSRFHHLVWSSYSKAGSTGNGVLVGGGDRGQILIYDVGKILSGQGGLIMQQEKHTGPVTALDFNCFQTNLLASGASNSELYIWDLASPGAPMSPGAKAQPPEPVQYLAWNRQVQHILASAFPGRAIIWDLRKNEPIIKVSDSATRLRVKCLAWHPEVATQLCLASEDDNHPLIELWDLRFATAPLKTFHGHSRGVLSLSWCPHDPDLLLSTGKDNRILCWNPNATQTDQELVCEVPSTSQWCFQLLWCPRNPALVASASFDGHVSIYSLMGGQQISTPPNKIAESFPGMSSFSTPAPPAPQQKPVILRNAPKWLQQPCGSSFAFGGKLVTWEKGSTSVKVQQVRSEHEVVGRAEELEEALQSGGEAVQALCEKRRLAASSHPHILQAWEFLKARLEEKSSQALLTLLGYEPPKPKGEMTGMRDGPGNEAHASDLNDHIGALDLKGLKSESRPLIRAVVLGEWDSVMRNCMLESWKEALAAALTYAKNGPSLMSLCQILGDRLQNEGKLGEAMACYISAGGLPTLTSSFGADSLQDIVEMAVLLQQNATGSGMPPDDPALNKYFEQYAQILCSQGQLQLAYKYLANSTQPKLVLMRERLSVALGMVTQQPQSRAVEKRGSIGRVRTYSSSSTSSYYQSMGVDSYYQPPPASASVSSTAPPPASLHQGMNQSPTPTHSAGTSKPQIKGAPFVADPSVSFQSSYNAYAPQAVPGSLGTYPGPTGGTWGGSLNATGSTQGQHPIPPNPGFIPPPSATATYSAWSYNSSSVVTDDMHAGYGMGGGTGPGSQASQLPSLTPPSSALPSVTSSFHPLASGWNDPPTLRTPQKPKQSTVSGVSMGQEVVPSSTPPPPVAPNPVPFSAPTQAPPKPIPAEHQVLHDVLQGLLDQCLIVTTHPQMKRKLDDVRKKLEILDEKLRNEELGPTTLEGLHQLVGGVRTGDYPQALAIHSQLVDSGSFATLSAFMPGLKSLLQVARQMGIYVH
ncbi:unnamed protein product [Darwinula stevensoni]|uniref:Protein transport protein Sec31A n=1 Tax=Darwinula stevensoni TaxID=69355 RepID=A0A7R9A7P8_9CRUS|nr:unnamed protein product [Darwinula stevensoni]CAG0892925.1 unnamed protein product [Darwinula stevensoni]